MFSRNLGHVHPVTEMILSSERLHYLQMQFTSVFLCFPLFHVQIYYIPEQNPNVHHRPCIAFYFNQCMTNSNVNMQN